MFVASVIYSAVMIGVWLGIKGTGPDRMSEVGVAVVWPICIGVVLAGAMIWAAEVSADANRRNTQR